MHSGFHLCLLAACALLATAAARAAPADPAAMFAQRLAQADANRDDAIDRVEAKASMPRLAVHFDELDANRDGRLTMAEFEQALQARWLAVDANRDGYIDKAEAGRAAMPRLGQAFDRLDGNGDGRLSQQELEQLAGRIGGRGAGSARR